MGVADYKISGVSQLGYVHNSYMRRRRKRVYQCSYFEGYCKNASVFIGSKIGPKLHWVTEAMQTVLHLHRDMHPYNVI